MTTRLTAKQVQGYFAYMDDDLSAEYMAAILLGQKHFNVGNGLIRKWELEKRSRSNRK